MRILLKKHFGKIVVLAIFLFGVSSVDASITIGRVKTINLDTDPNLIGWWKFDTRNIYGSTAQDSNPTATKNNGTMTGALPAVGILSQARTFNGTSDYISMGNVLNQGTSNWSASAWVKTTSGSFMGVINKSLLGTQVGRWGIYLNNSGNNIGCLSTNNTDGTGVVATITTTTHQNGHWHLITCTWNRSGNLTLYLDGVKQTTTDISPYGSTNFSTTDTLYVGSYADSSGTTPASYFNGQIDDVRVYNRVLTSSEVAQFYTQGTRNITVAKPKSNTAALANGLTGWWTFDGADAANSSGVTSFIDKTGNGYVATSSSIKLIPGKIGQAASTNGTNQFISVNHNSTLFPATTMSISIWCYIPDLTGVSSCTISKQSLTAKNGFVITYSISSDKKFYWRTGDGSATFPANSCNSAAITKPGWYHIVGVHNGTTEHSLYVNGQLVSCSITILTLAQNALQFWMGRNAPNGAYFKTTVDDVRVYNRALTATDVSQLYTQGLRAITAAKPKPVPVNLATNLVGWWTFDGKDTGPGYTVDRSGNANTATSTGAVRPLSAKIGQGFTFSGSGISTSTGGTITSSSGDWIHTFTSSGTFTPTTSGNAQALVVAGGGGGGYDNYDDVRGAGGGGGGGLIYNTALALASQAYTITVGTGGAGGTTSYGANNVVIGTNGADSTITGTGFTTVTATGGGGGGGHSNSTHGSTNYAGNSGGSGGGSANRSSGGGGTGNTPATTPSQGNNGGDGYSPCPYNGGGGGGAGAAGTAGSLSGGGAGGNGASYTISGSSVTYAGGGGSTGQSSCGGANVGTSGGTGGGGSGGGSNNGTANTGGGGGGNRGTPGNGGSGVVIVRYTPFGNAQYFSVQQSSSINTLSALSINAWVRYSSTAGNQAIMRKSDIPGGQVYGLGSDGTNFNFTIGTTTSPIVPTTITSTTAIKPNVWYLVSGTFDGTNMFLYVNGVKEATKIAASSGTATTGGGSFYIGSNASSTNYFQGILDEPRIYSRALSASEIYQLYRLGL